MKYTQTRYLRDYLIIEALSSFPITKTASVEEPSYLSTLVKGISSYVSNKFQGDITPSKVFNFLSPAIIYQIFSALNMKWIGVLAGLLTSVFKVDVASLVSKIISEIGSLIKQGTNISSDQISSIVDSIIPENVKTASMEQLIKTAWGNSMKENTLLEAVDKLKNAFNLSSNQGLVSRLLTVLSSVLSWFFITFVTATGFLVAGDAVGSLVKKYLPNIASPKEHIPDDKSDKPEKSSIKDMFKSNEGWTESIKNTRANIINLVLDYIEKKYPKADEVKIVNSPIFKAVVNHIENNNLHTKNYMFVIIPKNFKSPDDIADTIMSSIEEK